MLAAVLPAQAADAPPFRQLLSQALDAAPVLAEQQASVQAARADAAQAHAWPNPRVDALVENLGAPPSGGVSQRQNTYSITQPIELWGQRGARIEAGERRAAAARARSGQTRVAFAAELAIAYATAEAAHARTVLATEDLSRANDDLRAAQALVQAGKEADLRVAQARASVAAARANAQLATADETQALESLSALAGVDDPYSGVAASLLADEGAAERNRPQQEDSPAVVAARAERDALGAQVDVEQKKWLPEIGVTAGVRRYGWSDSSGYVVGVTATIPIFDRNAYGVEAARQRVAAADARLETARLESVAARRSAQAQVAAAEQRLAAAGEGEQAAAEAYRLGRIGYDAGRTSLVELLATRRSWLDARTLTIDARLARVRALATLAQASGCLAFSGE